MTGPRPTRPAALALGLVCAVLSAPAVAQDGGAEDPGAGWWAYRPVARPTPPRVEARDRVRNPIDAFVLARLEAQGLSLAAEADRRTLIRRLHYDLTGLPPTPSQVEAFAADPRPDAYERLVDELLASPQYGVKWARHWLDLVRYAETDSYERDRRKPNAWRYRDYVIDAFNSDKPYDRFVLEQLAGDELPDATLETVVATGYYRLGMWDDEPTDLLQAVYDDLDGIADTTARAFMAVSMGCARCHEHKKDPIPAEDYYRFLAFFENIKPYKTRPGNSVTAANYLAEVPAKLGDDDHEERLRAWRGQRQELLAEVRNLAEEAWSRLDAHERALVEHELDRGLALHLDLDAETLTGVAGLEARGTQPVAGRIGGARRFAGHRDGLSVPRPVQDDFTVAFWFRTTRPGRGSGRDPRWFTGSGLVDGEVPGIVDDFGVSLVADRVAAGTGKPETFVASPGGLADGSWHHVAFTRERATGRLRLHVDGVLVDEATGGTQPLTRPERLAIGRMLPGRGGFRGDLDDVRIYDRVLDERDVLALVTGGAAGRATELAVEARIGAPEGGRLRAAVDRLLALRRPEREMVEVLCVQERGAEPPQSFVRVRGNANVEGPAVGARVPQIFGGEALPATPPPSGESSGRRLALARWLVSGEHPTTARVIVNRIWQHHFGRGIVRTPNDFGRLGERPTHPLLLDWLASELVERGWSIKAMHRLILSSSTYRQASRPSAAARRADPDNDLFHSFAIRRLTAEEVRDSILAVTGELELEMGGPSVYPEMPQAVLSTSSRPDEAWQQSPPDQANRRSIYIHVKRSLLHPLLVAFDLAETDTSCPVRFTTTQPTQALTLLNSDFSSARAAKLAERLGPDEASLRERVAHGIALVTQRPPREHEIDRGLELIGELQREEGLPPEAALRGYCLMLLNLNEFLFVD